ncbi:MAG: hypothetical protein DMF83_23715 [Acidobacteria bacterium]|nr:MAG: hypothetical protein DMF83_23715 [Acidobacteriota bacterium]
MGTKRLASLPTISTSRRNAARKPVSHWSTTFAGKRSCAAKSTSTPVGPSVCHPNASRGSVPVISRA